MSSNGAVPTMTTGAEGLSAVDNVAEIFPGATRTAPVVNPVVNRQFRSGRAWRWRPRTGLEAGMATAEYAIATLAAVGFAGLLVVILKSDEVRGFLMNIIRAALSM